MKYGQAKNIKLFVASRGAVKAVLQCVYVYRINL